MIKRVKENIDDIYDKGFFHLFSANTLIHLIEFSSQLFVAWILLADDVGRIKSFQVYVAIAVIFAGLGFNSSVLKLCSEKIEKTEKENLFVSAFVYTLLASFITLIVFVFIAKLDLLSVDNRTNELFVYYAFTIPIMALNNLLIAYFQALKEFKKVSLYLVFARLIHIGLIITLTYYYRIEGFIIGVVIGFLFSLVLLFIKTKTRIRWNNINNKYFLPHWNIAKFGFSGNAVSSINLYLDFIILNHFIKDSALLGQYGFALTLMTGLRLFGYTSQQFVTPFYSERSDELSRLQKMFKKSERIFIFISFLVGILAILILPILIHTIFKGKYDIGMEFFIYLTIAWVIRSWYALKGPYLFSLGFMKTNFLNAALLLALSFLPTWFLIKEYGLLGAAYSQCLTALLGAIIVWFSLKNVMKKVVNLS